MSKINLKKVKWCWVATETKAGWRLKMAIGENSKTDIRLEGLLLASESEVKKIVKGNIVFVHRRIIVSKKVIHNK